MKRGIKKTVAACAIPLDSDYRHLYESQMALENYGKEGKA